MRTVHILLTSAALVLASFSARAQQWQLVTPIKVGSELRGMRMTDTFTGYAIDVAGKIALKTTDAGGQWERRGNGFSPYTPNALWMWDNDRGIVATNNGRFFRTTDGFTTTTAVITTFGTIGSLFFVNDLLGFAGANSGKILRTVDGGATWVQLVSGVANNIGHLFFVDAELGFASVGTSVLRTSDGGDTWAEIALEPGAYVSKMHFFDAQHGIGLSYAGAFLHTDDGGDTWTATTLPTTQTMNDMAVQGDVVVAVGALGWAIRSTDGGNTWSTLFNSGPQRYSVGLNPAGVGVITGAFGLIFSTTNMGAAWTQVYTGTPSQPYNKVSFASNGKGAAIGPQGSFSFDGGFVRSHDGGRHWDWLEGGGLALYLRNDGLGAAGSSSTTNYFATLEASVTTPQASISCVHAVNANTRVVGASNVNPGFYRTTDNGENWSYTLPAPLYDMCFPSALVGYAVGDGPQAYKTVDAGVTWTPTGNSTLLPRYTVFFLDDLRGWTGGENQGARTTDGGATWTEMSGIPSTTRSIIFTDADTGYVVGDAGQVLKSTDGGVTWAYIIAPLVDQVIGDAALVDGALVAVGNFGNIYRAELECPQNPLSPQVLEVNGALCTPQANSIQWHLNGSAIPGATDACYDPVNAGEHFVVVTTGLGCVSAPSETITVISTNFPDGSAASALTIFPNPSQNVITLHLSQGQRGTLAEVIDAQGRSVMRTTLRAENTTWDLSALDAGLYLVRCSFNGKTELQQFVKE